MPFVVGKRDLCTYIGAFAQEFTLYLLAPSVVSVLIKSLPESILQFTIAVVAIAIPMAVSRELR